MVTEFHYSKSLTMSKQVVASKNGVVSSQHHLASTAGANVLEQGGNAIDAAIATSFALGVVEPWMSGPGGGGFMVVKLKNEPNCQVVNFGMRSPGSLDPGDYPLDKEGRPSDLFLWPPVIKNRNLIGGGAVAVPGLVSGMGLAHETYATKSWRSLLEPAILLARKGLTMDWYTQLIISACVNDLSKFTKTRETFLDEHGNPKTAAWTASNPQRCELKAMADFLEKLSREGPDSFYKGEIAKKIVNAVTENEGCLSLEDLNFYSATISESLKIPYRNATLHAAPEMSAGQSLKLALNLLTKARLDEVKPQETTYLAYARALVETYSHRLTFEGDLTNSAIPTCTTHFSVADKFGNVVAVTQTLLSIFGSKLMVPELGILLNNGNMWFDPVPGKPNSLGPNKRCLSNMCPVIGEYQDQTFAIGAAGGRKILPAVFQLISFLVDFDMTLETAFHQPRIDASGRETINVDDQLVGSVHDTLAQHYPAQLLPKTVYPHSFAIPSAVSRINGTNYGITEITSPLADSIAHH